MKKIKTIKDFNQACEDLTEAIVYHNFDYDFDEEECIEAIKEYTNELYFLVKKGIDAIEKSNRAIEDTNRFLAQLVWKKENE